MAVAMGSIGDMRQARLTCPHRSRWRCEVWHGRGVVGRLSSLSAQHHPISHVAGGRLAYAPAAADGAPYPSPTSVPRFGARTSCSVAPAWRSHERHRSHSLWRHTPSHNRSVWPPGVRTACRDESVRSRREACATGVARVAAQSAVERGRRVAEALLLSRVARPGVCASCAQAAASSPRL
jgi:hypothetical protein